MKSFACIFISFCLLSLTFSCSDDGDDAPPPDDLVAEFSANATSITARDMVTFSDQSTGGATSWEWTFEGGTPETSTDRNPTITYFSAGSFEVRLTVTNSNSSDTETKASYITVDAPPIPDEFDIVGIWERVESNNASLDGMQVAVFTEGAGGEIVSSPSSSFPVGELKWRDLQKLSEHEYLFEDRFTDGTYDESSIFILGYGNELIIGNFNQSNLGSFQRWVRIDFQYPEDEDFSLVDIWERTKSNNPQLDGMRVEVDAMETQGEITETPDATNFPVGAIKWQNIQPEQAANRYTLEDLSSTGSYTEARLFIVGKGREVVVGIFTTNVGSFQRWTRD